MLQECNEKIGRYVNGKSKNFASMYDYTTGKIILSLKDVPDECNLILVSEYRPPELQNIDLKKIEEDFKTG